MYQIFAREKFWSEENIKSPVYERKEVEFSIYSGTRGRYFYNSCMCEGFFVSGKLSHEDSLPPDCVPGPIWLNTLVPNTHSPLSFPCTLSHL